jgi:hypothetical protein
MWDSSHRRPSRALPSIDHVGIARNDAPADVGDEIRPNVSWRKPEVHVIEDLVVGNQVPQLLGVLIEQERREEGPKPSALTQRDAQPGDRPILGVGRFGPPPLGSAHRRGADPPDSSGDDLLHDHVRRPAALYASDAMTTRSSGSCRGLNRISTGMLTPQPASHRWPVVQAR